MAALASVGGVVEEQMPLIPAVPNDSGVEHSDNYVVGEEAMDLLKSTEPAGEMSGGSISASPTFDFESGFYKMLMNPLMEKLEESVNRNNEILDDIMNKMKEEREQLKKKQLSAHIPLILQGKGRDVAETIQHVENFIEFENYDMDIADTAKFIKSNLRPLDKAAEVAIVSHSLAAFMSTLDSPHLKHLATKVVTDVTTWIGRLFQFSEAAVYFHEEEKEGLVKICQLAMHRKYPKYATDGYEVLFPRPPVIYVSGAAKPNLGQYLCHQIGLPVSCVSTVPCDVSRMDLVALQQLIEDDASSGKTPVIVIAQAGAPLTGQTDHLMRIYEICRLHDVWLHIEGCGLSLLAAPSIPQHLTPATFANSATFHLGTWLALPAVPFVTAFRSPDIGLSRVVGLSTFNVRYKLSCLSLWMCLLHLGHENIVARLMYYMELAKKVHDRIVEIPTSNELMVLDLESPVVIVRYQSKSAKSYPETREIGQELSKRGGERSEENRNSYFDTLNIWLVEALKREMPEFHISAVEVPKIGLCIRYSPLDVADMFDMSNQLISGFLDCFERHVHILDATVAVKDEFADIVESQDNLRLVHLPTWAGLGAVQFIADAWRDKLDSLPDVGKNEINVLNQEMVNQLKSTDTAFSLGVTQEGLYCIRFGLVTADTDLEELIGMVVATGKEVEESSKYLESMAEIIRQGIEKAEADLEKENQEKLLQTGVLRQVPLFGSLLNWWSPPPSDPVKGRCFNLASGKIASTETTYKYHMQVQENTVDIGTKVRDVPLKSLLKPTKSKQPHTSVSSVSESNTPASSAPESNTVTQLNNAEQDQHPVGPDESNLEQTTGSTAEPEQELRAGNVESVDVK